MFNKRYSFINSTDAIYALILSVDRAIALSTLARRPVETSLQAAGRLCCAKRKRHDLLSNRDGQIGVLRDTRLGSRTSPRHGEADSHGFNPPLKGLGD